MNKNTRLLSKISFFTDASSEIISAILPIYLTQGLGLGAHVVGIVEGVAIVITEMIRSIASYVQEGYRGRKIFVQIGYWLSAIFKLFYPLINSSGSALIIHTLQRAGKGIREGARDAIIAKTETTKLGEAFGYRKMMDNLGAVIGSLLALILGYMFAGNYWAIFAIAALPSLLGASMTANIVDVKTVPKKVTIKRMGGKFFLFLVVCSIFAISLFSHSFIVLLGADYGKPFEFFLVFNILYLIVSYHIGKGFDKDRYSVLLLPFVSMLLLGIAALFNNIIAAVFIVLFYAIGKGSIEVIPRAMLKGMGRAYTMEVGLIYSAIGMAQFLGTVATGFLWNYFLIGARLPLLLPPIFALLAAIVWVAGQRLFKHHL
ncbi:MAG: hypothetical protein QW035_03340 [Candidatus Anstonellales archaeon]